MRSRKAPGPLAAFAALAFLVLPPAGAALATPSSCQDPGGEREAGSLGASSLAPLTKSWATADSRRLGVGEHRVGARFRSRYLTWQNVYGPGAGVDAGEQAVRLRTQVSLDYRRTEALRFFALIANEATQRIGFEDRDTEIDEVIVENLYFEALEPWGIPIGLRVGRQDLFYGDGFLVADGGPLDQSRTTYVNGAVLTSRIPLWSFDVFALRDPRRDDYLPRVNNQYTPLIEADEFAWGIMARREPRAGTDLRYTLEPCYIYKSESNAGQAARIHTVGTRLGLGLGPVRVRGEGAYQIGKVPAREYPKPVDEILSGPQTISAFGFHARLEARPARQFPLDIAGGYVFLSGDELETRNKFEGWNPVLGRWAIWSEVVGLAFPSESYAQPTNQTLSYWQNLSMPFAAIAYRGSGLCIEANYAWLDAARPLPTFARLQNPRMEGATHRGELYALRFSWSLPGLVEGHVLYERFRPGEFYPAVMIEDGGDQVRFEPRLAEYFRLELARPL